MKTAILAVLATALVVPCLASAQSTTENTSEDGKAVTKVLVVSGKVSDDRQMLQTDIDSEWMVSNTDALKGHEGHVVRVRCYVDSARGKIHILSVKNDTVAHYSTARYADSAFRR